MRTLLIRMFGAMIQAVLVLLAVRLMDDLAEAICCSSQTRWRPRFHLHDDADNGRRNFR